MCALGRLGWEHGSSVGNGCGGIRRHGGVGGSLGWLEIVEVMGPWEERGVDGQNGERERVVAVAGEGVKTVAGAGMAQRVAFGEMSGVYCCMML